MSHTVSEPRLMMQVQGIMGKVLRMARLKGTLTVLMDAGNLPSPKGCTSCHIQNSQSFLIFSLFPGKKCSVANCWEQWSRSDMSQRSCSIQVNER